MKNYFYTLLIALLILPGLITAQSSTDFSLQGAIDYALKHNANYLNAELDIQMNKARRDEVRAMGLPQISGSLDVKDYFELPTSLLPGQFFGAPAGTFIPVKFGVPINATAGVSVSQIIFSPDYFMAIVSSKHVKALSDKALVRTKVETTVMVTKAYYTALMSRERLKTLDANLTRLKKLFDDTKILNTNGFVEKIDLDRIELAYNNLLTEKEKFERMAGITETLLKFQMGYDLKQNIKLTDEIKADALADIDLLAETKINYEARPEYSLLQTQQEINNLELKRNRLNYMPTFVGYGSYSKQAQRNEFDLFDGSKDWFPIGVVGATINVPIFNGGTKYYRVQQAKINILKTNNISANLKLAIDMEANISSVNYKNAYASLLTQKKNKELAQSIYDTAKKKYDAGVGSNIELITAETSLKESETNYLSAMFDLLMAKVDLDKALGNIK